MIRKTTYLMLVFLLTSMLSMNAQVTIGGQTDPQAFSVLELISEGKRGLRLPQLTTAEKTTLTNSADFQAKKTTTARGLMIFNRDTKCVEVWSGEKWISRCEEDQYVCDTPAMPGTITFSGVSNALNLNETFTARVSETSGMTYTWTVPYGMEITTNSNYQITVTVVKAGAYPLNLISVTATNDCGNTSAARTGNNSLVLEVNDCTAAPVLTSAAIISNTLVNGMKSGSGTAADPYTIYAGQPFTLSYIALVPGETYQWTLNSVGANYFTIENSNGPFVRLRAQDIINTVGDNVIGLSISNGCGTSGRVASQIYIKIEAITYPTITGTTPGSTCGAGSVTLGATASSGAEVVWYETATSTVALHTGSSFTTPSLATSRYYYAEAYRVSEDVASPTRTAVLATVGEMPTLTKVKDASRAGAGTVNLSGCATTPTSGANVRYFSTSTGGTALASNTTSALAVGTHTFYAEAYTTSCVSGRIAIAVTVTAGTGITISPETTTTILPAEGTDAQRTSPTHTVSNQDCLTSGSYSFEVISGTTYASIVSSNASAGTFAVRFNTNTSTGGRAAVVKVTDPCGNTKNATFTQAGVTVIKVSSISISGISSISIGGTTTLTANVSPSNAANKNVTWSVYSGGSYASVNSSGVVTGLAAGTAMIRATAADGSGIYGTYTVTVTTVKVTGISISGSSSVATGKTISLSASVSPSNATNKNITWSVYSGSSYASISTSGVVTGKAGGTVTIRATANDGSGVYASKTIAVEGLVVDGYILSENTLTVSRLSVKNNVSSCPTGYRWANSRAEALAIAKSGGGVQTSQLWYGVPTEYRGTNYDYCLETGKTDPGYRSDYDAVGVNSSGNNSYLTISSTWSSCGLGTKYYDTVTRCVKQ